MVEALLQSAVQGLLIGAIYALIALSMTLVFNVGGLLNFAHGDFLAAAMFGALVLSARFGFDPYLMGPLLALSLAALGAVLFRGLIRPVLSSGHLVGAQLTLGLVFIVENVLLLLFGGDVRSVQTVLTNKNLHLGPLVLPWSLVVGAGAAGLLSAALYWIIRRTDFGRQVRAITQNRDAAALMGISIGRVQTIAFALGLGLLGLTGPLIISQFTLTPTMGLDLTLLALIVMVFGGIGSFLGSLVGGLLIGLSEGVGAFLFGGTVGAMVPYGALVLTLLLRPHGLFGRR